jgi:hypothetical protein
MQAAHNCVESDPQPNGKSDFRTLFLLLLFCCLLLCRPDTTCEP